MAQGNDFQNTPEWYNARLFHFTSSELYKLMTEPRSAADKAAGKLSATAEGYVFDKVAEYLTNGVCLDYKERFSKDIDWGNTYEEVARNVYEQRTGMTVELCGFVPYNDDFGGSPDGLVGDDGIIEIKCPYNSSVHAAYLLMMTAEDLQRVRPEYYAQIQGNLLVTDRKWADFVSFDPRVQNDAFALKVLRVERDEDFIAKAVDALTRATRATNEIKRKLLAML